jgi:hypothetical protein
VPRITVELDVEVMMRDGVALRANVFRPDSGRWPALLTRLPYSKDGRWARDVLEPIFAAARNYAVVVQDTRGCFRSGGEWRPYAGESEDGADTIDWIASQPWCNGRVGMYGASYYGFTQWAAAQQRPAALMALVPFIAAGTSATTSSFGSVPDFGMHLLWDLQMRLASKLRSGLGPNDPGIGSLVSQIDGLGRLGYHVQLLDTSGEPELSAPPPPIAYGAIAVPALHVGAWYDIFLRETLAAFTAQRRAGTPSKLLIGPWTHLDRYDPIGERTYGLSSEIDSIDLAESFADIQVRWFDHWLKQLDSGVMDEPPVRIFVMGRNCWRFEDDWPPPGAVATRAYLRAGGRLALAIPRAEPPDIFEARTDDPVPTLGGATMIAPPLRAGPFDQRVIASRPDVLEYATEPLARDVEISGPVRARLWARSASEPFDLVARLVDIEPDGRAVNLTDSMTRVERNPRGQGNETRECVLDLAATSNLFRAGHRIALHVTWSSFPRWLPISRSSGGEPRVVGYEIFHDSQRPSYLELPVLGADTISTMNRPGSR